MKLYSYNNFNQFQNESLLIKDSLDKPSYLIDFADGIISGATLTSAVTVATASDGSTATANCVNSTTTSGSQATVNMLTCGAGGTGSPTDGSRFRMRTTATLSAGGPLVFDIFIYVRNKTYAP